jgi:hypothetical protein
VLLKLHLPPFVQTGRRRSGFVELDNALQRNIFLTHENSFFVVLKGGRGGGGGARDILFGCESEIQEGFGIESGFAVGEEKRIWLTEIGNGGGREGTSLG